MYRDQIAEQMKLEVAKEVKEQMDAQMQEHLPVPLSEQAEESRRQIVEVKHALQNSYVLSIVFLCVSRLMSLGVQRGTAEERQLETEPQQHQRPAGGRPEAGRDKERAIPRELAFFVLVRQ